MNCKLQPDSAAEKYKIWLAALREFGIQSFDDVWSGGVERDGTGDWSKIKPLFAPYIGCGPDESGRSIMWVRAGATTSTDDEVLAVKAGIIYYMATHADMTTLRSGITFVVDTTGVEKNKRIGNENKLQKARQAMPSRPQKIYVIGAGLLRRIVINAAIRFASIFTKEKLVERLKFVEVDEVISHIPHGSLPTYLGGACPVTTLEQQISWLQNRLLSFPLVPRSSLLFPDQLQESVVPVLGMPRKRSVCGGGSDCIFCHSKFARDNDDTELVDITRRKSTLTGSSFFIIAIIVTLLLLAVVLALRKPLETHVPRFSE